MYTADFSSAKDARSFARIVDSLGYISETHFDFSGLDDWFHRVYARKSRLAKSFGTRYFDFKDKGLADKVAEALRAMDLSVILVYRCDVADHKHRLYVKEV